MKTTLEWCLSNFAYLIYVNKSVWSLYSLKVATIVQLEAIMSMLIRWSIPQNSAEKPR